MGRNARLRKDRAKKRSAAASQLPPQAPLEALQQAIEAVGDKFGTDNRCADAAALLITVGKYLGYKLEPRPVSLIAAQPSSTDPSLKYEAYIGPAAARTMSEEERERANKDHLGDGENLGHLVLTCDDPPLLLDPNLRQLRAMGFDAPSLRAHIHTSRPESGTWYLPIGELNLELFYILDDEASVLLENFDAAVAAASVEARSLAQAVQAGYTAEQIREVAAY
ncbi:hypothetical protein SAMN04487912_104293 [Arthrobacter sp. cf158]|uniref:hypothetical protein n=1 Tax=Arthrobacter sp. cf158 TaxID=1761744 RepID=UPI00089646B2|nr:hypothetical protein [Arthrobacter sp. cf158]SDW74458.1 hypothetical protein SAMN04487912_104293 [Arthrobacter sp. cf158]